MSSVVALDMLNALPADRFAAALEGIYEHSPWIPQRAAVRRPFGSRLDLLEALQAVVAAATREEQLALVRAHPELAGKAAVRDALTPESRREQAGAGLSACTPEEFARLHRLNAAYGARFGFPFVLSVKGHDRASILAHFERRLGADFDTELATALAEIGRIAAFRLAERVSQPAGAAILAMAERLARHSEQQGALSCPFMTPAHQAAARQLRDWMLQAGLEAHIDAIGNVVGRWRSPGSGAGSRVAAGAEAGAKTLMSGSHYDTVADAGRYDGRLGVLLPIVVVEQLRQAGLTLPFDLEVLAFSDEEGLRFRSTFLGSSALAGAFDTSLLERRDAQGISLREALQAAGHDPQAIPSLARDPRQTLGYVEVHIEQGPALLAAGQPLGVVTAINGSLRYQFAVSGQAGHAGTVPMALRHDAAAAAAELLLYVEQRCAQQPGLVGTVGQLQVPDGAINVIPGRCELSLDLRAPDDALRDAAARDILAEAARIAQRRGVEISAEPLMQAAATPCAPALQAQLAASIARLTGAAQVCHLPSGAGHDAMMMARLTPVGMLFVRCGHGGISHHPEESLDAEDAELAARVFADFLLHYAG
jgi:allantoate deiminase/N-carbamoyl-L-amino-acid hydrolase